MSARGRGTHQWEKGRQLVQEQQWAEEQVQVQVWDPVRVQEQEH